MIKHKKIKVLIVSILCILTITIGLSYGYYLLNKVQKNNNIAGSKCFNLEFTNEKNAISLDNMYPISDEEGRKLTPYSFTITNTCDMLAGYTVNMEMLEGTTLNSKYLDVMINNEEIKLLTNYESANTVITGSTESRILAKGTLAYNDSVDYTVRFWMDKDVEDTEAMNKIFKSKIVISAIPSSWNPKDAGYDTLHDAILANEYQTTPADAISKIEAKGTPDFSQTAPIIKWQSVKINDISNSSCILPHTSLVGEQSLGGENLTLNDTMIKLSKSFVLDSDKGRFKLDTLKSYDIANLSDLNFENENYYWLGCGTSVSSTNQLSSYYLDSYPIMFRVKKISVEEIGTPNTSSYRLKYNIFGNEYKLKELENDKSDQGLYRDYDNYGITYYYRGSVSNNIVYFAGFYWKIIRINGDNSIRILYAGTSKNSVESSTVISSSQFNFLSNSPAYVGYMYGNDGGAINSREDNLSNIFDSKVKRIVDDFYNQKILDGYSKYLSDSGFCGDRSLHSGDGYSINSYTEFAAANRLMSGDPKPTLKCFDLENDLYTTKNSLIGNKALNYPIGLITADELSMSGMVKNSINTFSYTYGGDGYWTMTPYHYNSSNGNSNVWNLRKSGEMYSDSVYGNMGIRPVINLKSDVKITGGIGTSNDPYVIDTNN